MHRTMLVRATTAIIVLAVCALTWANSGRDTHATIVGVIDPGISWGGTVHDNEYDTNLGYCLDGFILHVKQTQLSNDLAVNGQDHSAYSVQLTGAPVVDNSSTVPLQLSTQPSETTPTQILAGDGSTPQTLPDVHRIFLYSSSLPSADILKSMYVNLERWDHGLLTADAAVHHEDANPDENHLSPADTTGATNNDDEFGDSQSVDGDGTSFTDESSWDDLMSTGTVYDSTGEVGNCSVLPTTQAVVTPAPNSNLNSANSTGWNNGAVSVGLTATDADANFVDSSINVDHVTYSVNGGSPVNTAAGTSAVSIPVSTEGVTTVTYYATDTLNNTEATKTIYVNIDKTAPAVTCPATPPAFSLNQANASFPANFTDAGSGFANGHMSETINSNTVDTSVAGSFNASFPAVTDQAGNTNNSAQCPYRVFSFSGFFAPVDNQPVVNLGKVGRTIPMQFSLHGNQGLDVLASGSPTFQLMNCSALSSNPTDALPTTASSPGSATLSYDAASDTYTYPWKTSSSWSGQCGQFSMTLVDGTTHTSDFKFK